MRGNGGHAVVILTAEVGVPGPLQPLGGDEGDHAARPFPDPGEVPEGEMRRIWQERLLVVDSQFGFPPAAFGFVATSTSGGP